MVRGFCIWGDPGSAINVFVDASNLSGGDRDYLLSAVSHGCAWTRIFPTFTRVCVPRRYLEKITRRHWAPVLAIRF
jgi:hypothetical protein